MAKPRNSLSRRGFVAGCAGGLAATACAGPERAPRPRLRLETEGPRIALRQPAPMLPPAQAILLSVRGMPDDPDELSVVWTFVLNGKPPQVGISAAHEHVATALVAQHREFVLNVPTADLVMPFDKVDMASTEVADKFALAGLRRGAATVIDAPTVAEAPIQIECRVTQQVAVPPARQLFVADVVATTVLPGVCDADEMLIVDAVPFFGMTAGSGEFYTMGERIGHIGQTRGAPAGKYRY